MRLILIALALLSFNANANANADGIELFAGAWSKHIHTQGLNEEHDLLALRYNGYVGGNFTNSYDRETWFAGKTFNDSYGVLEYGIITGAMYGYTSCLGNEGKNSVVCPVVVPYITLQDQNLAPVVMLMGEAVTLSFKIKL